MNSKVILGAALIVLAASIAGGGFYGVRVSSKEPLDPLTLCPMRTSGSVTIVIIDKTDPLTPVEQEKARRIVERERDAAQRGDRVIVKMLKQAQGTANVVLETVVNLCNPGSEANPFFENPKRVALRYRQAFVEPIAAALASVEGQSSAPSSPIARSIQSAIDELNEAPKHLKLLLISDLMEHNAGVSAYNGSFRLDEIRKLLTPQLQSRLGGAAVEILLLPRPRYAPQQEAALKVWRLFFKEVSGAEPSVIR